ncbi:MAG: DegV family protein with EDD domain [Candidatus Aldehydirespiratoraceae bacterium]
MTVRIVTDSACDLRGEEVERYGIEVVPLSIRFGDDEYVDREELTVTEFYRLLAGSEALPETSAPAPGKFVAAFQRQLDAGATGVVCINISAALSATMQSAQTALDQLKTDLPDAEVHVVDSGSITAGQGSIVLAAAQMGVEGASASEIVAAVADLSNRTQVYGALDTLDNLKKGGRVGGAAALVGSLLSIKPIIDISTGVVEEAGKQRTRKKSLVWLRDKLVEVGPVENLAVMHGEAPDIDDFLAMISEIVDIDSVRVDKIGPVVGTHGGPRVMGLAFQTPA